MTTNSEQLGPCDDHDNGSPRPDVLSIDDLVRHHLETRSTTTDVRRLRERLVDSLAADAVPSSTARSSKLNCICAAGFGDF